MVDWMVGEGRTEESEIQDEISTILGELGQTREELPDFSDWYSRIRSQYGRPSAEAREYLLRGDFATFERMLKEGE